jgi:hypothetical protein
MEVTYRVTFGVAFSDDLFFSTALAVAEFDGHDGDGNEIVLMTTEMPTAQIGRASCRERVYTSV